jgi:VWFA-related protein
MRVRLAFGFSLVWVLTGASVALPQAPRGSGAKFPPLQAPAPSAAKSKSQQGPVIRSITRLIQLSVIVQNKKGKPITGLKKEDFAVFDEGQAQNVAFFTAELPTPAPAHPLPPGVFTNRFDLKGQDPGAVTIVLFDALNTSVEDQAYVRQQIIHFLQSLKPQDRVAVYALTTQLIVLREFTQDATELVKAVRAFQPKSTAAYDASTTVPVDLVGMTGDTDWAGFQAALNNANAMIADQDTLNRVGTTVGAFEAIANHVAAIPGRKSLVWVSGGFPIQIGVGNIGAPSNAAAGLETADTHDPRAMAGRGESQPVGGSDSMNQLPGSNRESGALTPDVSEAARALNRVNIAIYPVDAKGVEIDSGMTAGMRSGSSALGSAFFNRQDTRDSSRLLADRTGGEAFFGSNDIRDAMRRAFDDGRYAYTIGFYPEHGQWNGEFRELKVKVKGSGARLRYRRGYFAFADKPSDAEAVVNVDLQEAARSPLESTSLGMIVSGKPVGALSERNVALRIGVDVKQFLLQEVDGHQKGSLDLLFVQRNAAGAMVSADKQHVDLNMDPTEYERFTRVGMVLGRHVTVLPQSEEFRVLVRDTGSGSVGSVSMPVSAIFPPDGNSAVPVKKTD